MLSKYVQILKPIQVKSIVAKISNQTQSPISVLEMDSHLSTFS